MLSNVILKDKAKRKNKNFLLMVFNPVNSKLNEEIKAKK